MSKSNLKSQPVQLPISALDFPKFKQYKQRCEFYYYATLVNACSGNMSKVSSVSGVGRPYVYKKVKQSGLDPETFRKVQTGLASALERVCDLAGEGSAPYELTPLDEPFSKVDRYAKKRQLAFDDLVRRGIIKSDVSMGGH